MSACPSFVRPSWNGEDSMLNSGRRSWAVHVRITLKGLSSRCYVEAEEDNVNLLEEDGDPDADESADGQEQFPAAGVEGVPTAVPPPALPASDSVRLSRLMAR